MYVCTPTSTYMKVHIYCFVHTRNITVLRCIRFKLLMHVSTVLHLHTLCADCSATHAHTCLYVHVCVCVCVHVCMYLCMCMYIHTQLQADTQRHKHKTLLQVHCLNICTHIYSHAYTQTEQLHFDCTPGACC
jgi:hypothetical protein